MSLASDLRVRTEVTNTVPVVNTLPAVSLSVLDQSINSLPPCNKVEQAMKKCIAKFIKEPTMLPPRQTNHMVNEVVKQHSSIGENIIFPTPTEIHSMYRNLSIVMARQDLSGGQWGSFLLHKIGQCILLGISTALSIMCYAIQPSLIGNIY